MDNIIVKRIDRAFDRHYSLSKRRQIGTKFSAISSFFLNPKKHKNDAGVQSDACDNQNQQTFLRGLN